MKKSEITIEISASDFYETGYNDSNDCAITRALQRAGYDLVDTGSFIKTRSIWTSCGNFPLPNTRICATPEELTRKVAGMYLFTGDDVVCGLDRVKPIPPANFKFTIKLN